MKTRMIVPLCLLILLAVTGCDRYVESENPVRSLPDALPAPVNVAVTLDDQSVTLDWQIPDSTGVDRFRVYVADTAGGQYQLRDSSSTYTTTIGNLVVNRTYYLSVAAVSGSGLEGLRSTPVTARVGLLSIMIENNDEFTNSRDVRIQSNSVTGTSHIRLSEDSLFADAAYVAWSSQSSFTLSAGDGEKTVYGQYIFSDGSRSGQLLTDDIILDTRVSIDSVHFDPAGPFATGDTILFAITAGETGGEASISFSGVSDIVLYDDGTEGDLAAADAIYSASFVIPNDLVVADEQVIGSFTDAAGNNAQTPASRTLSIQSTPLPVQLITVEERSSSEIALTWTTAPSSDFASYRIYRDATSGVSESSFLVETITGRSTTTFTDNDLDESTTYYYRVYVYNSFGLMAGSNVASATTDINEPPEAVVLAGRIVSDSTIGLSWSINGDEDFDSYRVFRDNSGLADPPAENLLIQVINGRSVGSFDDIAPGSTTYHYKVYVYDQQGRYAGSNEVVITR